MGLGNDDNVVVDDNDGGCGSGGGKSYGAPIEIISSAKIPASSPSGPLLPPRVWVRVFGLV
ncbi:hypothetical protein TorRG33x02_060070 [Trema orientale]|uniref:Uncharacterized protein n=1 Tax=Trema orientale TaxID=63057 RepID=A0A2P5FK72_TREOI|nr:hypothetical protein TorRG33x02_060070 [Trema orientale]